MVSTRFLGLVSTVLLVVGALALGEALHRTVVTGEASLTSPLILVYLVVGAVAIALGYRARGPVGRRYALGSDDEREDRPPGSREPSERSEREGKRERRGDAEFDPAVSPLGDAAPGDARPDDTAERDRPSGDDSG